MLPAASVSGLYFWRPGGAVLRRRQDRARPGRGLRATEGTRRRQQWSGGWHPISTTSGSVPTLRELLADGRVHVAGRRDGHDALRPRRFPQRLLRRAQPQASRSSCGTSTANTSGPAPRSSRRTPSARIPVKLADLRPAAETERINARGGGARAGGGGRLARPWSAPSARSACGIEPFGEMSVAEARDAFAPPGAGTAGRRRGWLHSRDVQRRRTSWVPRRSAVRAVSDLPIIAQMTVGTDGKTHYGTDPVVFGPELPRWVPT